MAGVLYCVQECFGRYSRATIILAQSFCGILREGSRSARALTALAAFVFACLLPVFAAAQSDGLPSAPTGLRTNGPTSNAISIIWVPTWRGADAYFEYRVDSGSWTKVANSDDSYSSVRILDLLPGTYTFGIRAVNAQGPGPASTVTGTVRGPTSAPGGLRIVGTTSTSVGLDWNKVTGATGYEYQQDGGRWVAVLTSDVLVSNLKDGQVYRFRVRATNADGYGPSSPELVVSPSGTEGLRYEPPQSLHVGEQIIPMKPIAINRDNVAVVVEYRLIGGTTLPPGLSLNSKTGVISGAPTTLNTNSMRVEVQGDGNNGFDPTTTISFPPVSKAASFSGTLTGAVTEDAAAATATGTVTVNDDDGKNNVQAQTGTAGVYGTFSITAAGVWTYSLDNSDRDTNALAGGMIVTEEFVIRADDGTRATVTVTITGANDRPTANAGPDRFAYRNTMVGLVSRNSFDPDADDHLIYSWARKAGDGGPSVTLSNSDRRNAVFTAPNEARGAVLTFVLTVTDKAGASHTDEVIITVEGIPSLDISPTTLTVAEGGSSTYTVKLNTQPSANVKVTVGGTSETDLTVSPGSLTFTTENWNTAQTVTASAAEDADAVDDTATLTHTASGGGYGSVSKDLRVTVEDNDTAAITVSPTTLTVAEGGSSTYTVVLNTQPSANVKVTVGGTSETDLTVSPGSLTFTTENWNTAQTVTASAAEDADAVDDTATLTHTASGGGYGSVSKDLRVTVEDNDTAAITVSPTTLTVAEGGSSTYTVVLNTQPSANVKVTVGGTSETDLTVSPGSLTFTTENWNTAQTVTASAAEDADAVDDTATLTHTASGGGYGSVSKDLRVTVEDNDTAAITVSPTTLTVAEGGSSTYTVVLNTQPSANVKVTVGGTSETDLTVSPGSLTFTTENWNTAQTVTASAAEDADAVDDTATLTHTASGGGYGSVSKDLRVTVEDNDTAAITVSPTALTVAEGGSSTYTVVLNTQPSANVKVTVGGTSETDLTVSPGSLTFTTENWNTAQTVTASAAEDADAVDDTATLTHTASGGGYGSVSKDLRVTVEDNDTAAITVSPTALTVAEGGSSTYTVVLNTQPSANVKVTVGGTSETDLTVSPGSLTFTTENWNTAQTVTASAAEDADAVDDTATLTHTASGGGYGSVSKDLRVTVEDNDTAAITVSPTALTVAEGGSSTYTVVLNTQPSANVKVTVGGTSETDLTVSPGSLTFTTENWNTAQTVTASAAEDADAVDDTATLTHTASGGGYGSVSKDLRVTVEDNDTAAITVSPTALTVAEGGSSTYTVVLNTQPSANVKVTVGGTSETDLTVSPGSLTFTTENWNTAQTVTASAAEDADAVDDTATLTHTASGGGYGSVSKDLRVTVEDNDTAAITVSPTALTVAEGGSSTYTVVLNTQPSANVKVTVGGTSETDLTVSPGSLTFTTENWNTAQTVTASAAEDADAVDDTATLTHTASGGGYGSVSKDLRVTVEDNDTAAITVSPTTLTVAEGGSSTYTVVLNTQPSANVKVTVGGTSETDLTVSPGSLTFTTENWNTAQTVTASAAEDADAVDDTATLTHTASGGGYGSVSKDLRVTVEDNDTAAITVSPTALTVAEGGSSTYTVVLNTQPSANVKVTVGGTSETDLTVSPGSLTFTTENWNTAQTVTASAAEDADAVDDTATLTHTASGGGYGSVSKDLRVTVEDNDTAAITVSPTTLTVGEGGSSTYTVKLNTQPSANVKVTVGGTSETDLTVSPSSLTFTTENWNTAQTVTVSAAEDADAVDDTATLTHSVSGYGSVSSAASVTVTVTEGDGAKLIFSTSALTVDEGEKPGVDVTSPPNKGTATYTVKLNTQPSANVKVTVGGTSETDLTVSPSSLTFTTENWNTAQTVTVKAAADDDAENDDATLTHTASGGGYDSVSKDLKVTINDDDTAGITVSKTDLSFTEGGSDTYTVKLNTQPSANVTVTVGGASGDITVDTRAETGNQNTLTFTIGNWDTAQTVTVTAAADDDAVDDTATLTHSVSGYGSVSSAASVMVSVDDDDPAGITVSPTTLTVDEGGSDTYTVVLDSQPAGEVTVTVEGATVDITVDTSSLTFTTDNWNTPQTVTVSAAEDADAVDDTATLTHSVSGYGSVSSAASVMVTVDDEDTPGITVSPTTLPIEEGEKPGVDLTSPPNKGTATYTVKLATEPTGAVKVTVGGASETDLTVSPSSLTFTTENWDTAQTVTVKAAADDDAEDDDVTLTHTASGGGYDSVSKDLKVTINDDDTAGITVSKTDLSFTEGGSDTYTVKLNTQPSANVTVTVGGASGDITVDTRAETGNQNTLTFTIGNWDTAQTVTVTAAADDDAVDDTATLTHSVSGYGSVSSAASVMVSVDDDDPAGITVSPTTLTVDEGGSDTYTVVLDSQPAGEVTVTVEGATVDITVDTSSLTFTTDNWNTPQTVTVSAAEDADAVDDTATLTHSVSGYGSVSSAASVMVTVDDEDTPGITVSPTTLPIEEGEKPGVDLTSPPNKGTATYTVKLATEPTGAVKVTVGGASETDLTVSPSSLTFTTENWDTAQTVTVKAAADDDAEDDDVTLTHTASGGGYGSVSKNLKVTINDDDTAGITVSEPALTIKEGEDGSYTVVLDSQPAGDVTVTVEGATVDITVDTSSLTFTTENWDTAQTVTVSAAQDADAVDDTATLTHSVSGYGSVSSAASVTVTVDDDETAGITVSPTTLTIAEGSDKSYTVVLDSQPAGEVTVTVEGATVDITVDTSSLTFTTENWDTAQTVTVSAAQDADAVDDTATLTHSVSGYGSVSSAASVSVTVTEGDGAKLVFSTGALTVDEGEKPGVDLISPPNKGTATYTVKLATEPTGAVTVAISGASETDLTVNPGSLTFTTENWDTAQTVTVKAAADDDAEDNDVTLTHTASGGGYGSVSKNLKVTINDDDTAGITVSESDLTIKEGGSDTYTVVLNTQPSANVKVTVGGVSETDLTVSPSSLTFTTENWDTPQTVTVSAAQDADAVDDTATLTHSVSGYGSVSSAASVMVSVDDDDPAGITVSPTTLTVDEGGSDTYTVVLDSQPAGEVTVTVEGASGDITVDTSSLTFTTENWDTPQTVTVSAAEDADAVDDTATLRHTASGGGQL